MKTTAKVIMAALTALFSTPALAAEGLPPGPDKLIEATALKPRGEWVEVKWPATLDLAGLMELSVNCLTGNVDPEKKYAVHQVFKFESTGLDLFEKALTWNITPKNARALPLLRSATGSEKGLETEVGMMTALMSAFEDDGRMYYPVQTDGAPLGTSYPISNGMMGLAFENWYRRSGDARWLDWIQLVAKGLRNTAIAVEDRSYFPPECGINREGEWVWTTRGEATIPYTPPEEPYMEQQGLEGCVKFEQASPIRLLVRSWKLFGDAESLDKANRIERFCLKPGMWEDLTEQGFVGSEVGAFAGHFHGNMTSLHALFDLALAKGDRAGCLRVQHAYEYARATGVMRLGWVPAWVMPAKYHRDDVYRGQAETCGVADMLVLAVKLSDAGFGSYWDDVDALVRNHLIAQQITDLDMVMRMSQAKPEQRDIAARFIGGFNQGEPTAIPAATYGCCSVNGAVGLYYAWHGITRFHDGIATVNLFLNRVSPWMDIASWLPNEGIVEFRNKQAHTLSARIPVWVNRSALVVKRNGTPVPTRVEGDRLILTGLAAGDVIRMEFPVTESTERYTIREKVHTLTVRGSTVVDIAPRDNSPQKVSIYNRESDRVTPAPMTTAKRFVTAEPLPLQ